jgi:hypothetical protein
VEAVGSGVVSEVCAEPTEISSTRVEVVEGSTGQAAFVVQSHLLRCPVAEGDRQAECHRTPPGWSRRSGIPRRRRPSATDEQASGSYGFRAAGPAGRIFFDDLDKKVRDGVKTEEKGSGKGDGGGDR